MPDWEHATLSQVQGEWSYQVIRARSLSSGNEKCHQNHFSSLLKLFLWECLASVIHVTE